MYKDDIQWLRDHRNTLLKDSDWVLTYDNALSLSNLDEWIQYRKTLRDFFKDPDLKIIYVEGMPEMIDRRAMGFPIRQPPILRKPT